MATGREAATDHDGRAAVYDYLDRHGPTDPESARSALDMDPRGFRHHVAILKRDGYLAESEGRLRAIDDGGERERFEETDVEFTIRPARESDLSGLVGVIRQVTAERSHIEAESVADVVDHEETLLRHDEIEERMFFVACVDGEVVGWVHLHVPELDKLRHTAELTVGVLEEYRGHGIGSHLVRRGLEWAGANGLERIYQSAPATNQAVIDFLEGHGWEVEAVREDHYRIDGDYVDEVMMAVDL